jgi:hypothetical protein
LYVLNYCCFAASTKPTPEIINATESIATPKYKTEINEVGAVISLHEAAPKKPELMRRAASGKPIRASHFSRSSFYPIFI